MNHEELKTQLGNSTGCSAQDTVKMLDATIEAMKEYARDLDTVAIPGFGSFSCTKHNEHIDENPETGEKMLTPPEIRMCFKSSVVLRKKFVG